MKRFAELYERLDATTSTREKVAAMVDYFESAPLSDAAWAVYFLSGRRLKRFISSRTLARWFLGHSGMAEWLYTESYVAVGDTAETIALLMDRGVDSGGGGTELSLARFMEDRLLPLRRENEDVRRETVLGWWRQFPRQEVFMLNKILSGGFRVGVSQPLVIRALAQWSGLEKPVLAHRLMGDWHPDEKFMARLTAPADEQGEETDSRPYPFYLAYPLDRDPEALGPVSDWQVEWKWDGIRAQWIYRGGEVYLWSRGEELITHRFPELTGDMSGFPEGVVLDGEILAWGEDMPRPFSVLQTRLGRKKVSRKLLAEAPAVFMAYDILELNGTDLRQRPLAERRQLLEDVLTGTDAAFRPSPVVRPATWEDARRLHKESRRRGVEGYMLKHRLSPYKTGRVKGDWWKWKVDPFTVDAVLIYAQAGHGRRANLFTDYTFAVWREDENNEAQLVPVAKAYSGLSREEIARLDRWIRDNTRDRFGPVRQVTPEHVFEIAFEGIAPSSRHKSGVALRFPRILRWREDKKPMDADRLSALHALLEQLGA